MRIAAEVRGLQGSEASGSLLRSLGRAVPNLSMYLAVTGLIEFLCLRLLIRLGPVLPHTPEVVSLTEALIFIGGVALNAAMLLSLGSLAACAFTTTSRPLSGLLIAFVALALGSIFSGYATHPLIFSTFIALALVLVGVVLWSAWWQRRELAWLGLCAASYAALAYPTFATTLHLNLPGMAEARALSELLALTMAIGAPFVLRPPRSWRAIAFGLVGAVLLSGMWFSVPWLAPTLMIWSVGMSGFLPAPVYVLALGLWIYTISALSGARGDRSRALGLVLVALGGLRWDMSYYVLLAIAGFVLLSGRMPAQVSDDIPTAS